VSLAAVTHSCPVPAKAGIGLRFQHHQAVLDVEPDVAWMEVHTENYMGGGTPLRYLDAIRRDFPIALHGVGLSLGSAEGLRAWRDMVIAQVRSGEAKGGCPLGSLAGQLAETDPRARTLLADGFGQWQAAIGEGLRRLRQAGQLPDGTDPDALAVTLLATLQGGLLLAQVQRDTRPLETAVDTLLQLARSSRPDVPAGSGVPAP